MTAGDIVKFGGWVINRFKRRRNRKNLEKFLMDEKETVLNEDKNKPLDKKRRGQFTIPHIEKGTGLIEDQIKEAARKNKLIRPAERTDPQGRVIELLYEYVDKDHPHLPRVRPP